MPIINKGLLNTKDIYLRKVGNDWPTAQVITTSDIIESESNLYFTNTRVVTALVAGNNITIEANGRISSTATGTVSGIDLSGNTTTDLAEGANLYFTNTRVLAALESQDINLSNLTVLGDLTVQGNTTFGSGSGGSITDLDFLETVSITSNVWNNLYSSNVVETTNLYFTNARVQSYLDESGYQTAANILANVIIGIDLSGNTTTDLAEGANLYFTNARVLTALSSATIPGNITVEGTVAANSFTSTGFGIPTIESETNIVLSANGYNGSSVVIQNSPIRIRSYTEANLSSLTPGTGDVIYNSTISKLQVYSGSEWANVGGTPDAVIDLSSVDANILPSVTETYNLGSPDKKWKDLYLSGNTIVLGNVTLSDQGGKLKLDSVEAGEITIDRLSLYTAGRGITISGSGIVSTSADDSELYDIGIDKQVTYFPTNTMETAFSLPASEEYRYLLQSFVVTNISADNAVFYCDLLVEGNTYSYANNFIIPFGYSIDLIDRPEILKPNTVVRMRATANNTLSTYVIYKTVDDISYDSQLTTISQSNIFQTIYTAGQGPAIVENIKFVNKTNTLLRGTVTLVNANSQIKAYVASNTLLAKQYYTDTILRPLRLELGDSIRFANFNGEPNGITSVVTARLGEIYTITPNITTVNEGQSVTFAITTVNVPSNTLRYYRTTGNISSSDFVEGNTGSFLVVDGAANITLTPIADSSYDENEEVFQLQILNALDAVLKTSENILVKDTSNVTVVQTVNLSSNSIYTSESVVFTINTKDGSGNAAATFYYTTTGNAEIYGGNTGSIIINDNIANLELIAEVVDIGNDVRQFALQVRRNSISGDIVLTTENISVRDLNNFDPNVLVDSIVATGGTVQEIEE